ncbi:14139_t:CDS:1, partial [Rhizophagus irregularis]
QNLVSISTRTRHQKKYSQSGNIQKSSTDEQESDKDDEDIEILKRESSKDEENDKNTEILDLEFPNYELIFQETIDKSDN